MKGETQPFVEGQELLGTRQQGNEEVEDGNMGRESYMDTGAIESDEGAIMSNIGSTSNQLAECAICRDPFLMWGGPITLQCGHFLCLQCLQKMQRSAFSRCPLCHSAEETADYLKRQMELGVHSLCQNESTSNGTRSFFFYELPHPEETGEWVPVSVPPMDLEDYERSLYENDWGGGYFPEPDEGTRTNLLFRAHVLETGFWGTLNIIFQSMLGKGKVLDIKSSDKRGSQGLPHFLADTTEDIHVIRAVLEAEPPMWMPDSAASSCMQCGTNFRPLTCTRHHCRFCGGLFCNSCSSGRSLMPAKFRQRNLQRVCDTCWLRLGPTQRMLLDQVSNAAQIATYDVTDWTSFRAWLNSPWGLSMEHEIYKATNTLRSFYKIGELSPEKSMPDMVLRGAKGLAILSVLKVGMMVTYRVGTGVLIARRPDNTWSPPAAIGSCGIGWGAQIGGELTDFILVLRTEEAVKAFGGQVHLSVGAGLSAAVGPIGRTAEADVHAVNGSPAACYSYSCSKGAFIGCSLEGSIFIGRPSINVLFYGDPSIKAADILMSSTPRPRAAAPLYDALADLFNRSGNMHRLVSSV